MVAGVLLGGARSLGVVRSAWPCGRRVDRGGSFIQSGDDECWPG